MNREEWLIHIDMAERFVAEGLAQIEKQRRLIQELESKGGDATRARAFLTTLLESQMRYERHRDRLRQEAGAEQLKAAPAPLLSEDGPELAPQVTDDPQAEAPAPLLNEESPELAGDATDGPQDDSDRSPQAEAVDQEADRWMQSDSGDQIREP